MNAADSTSQAEPQYSEAPPQQAPAPTPEPAPAPAPEPAAAPAENEDEAMIERIKELSDLHDQGILTDEQFEEAKHRIID